MKYVRSSDVFYTIILESSITKTVKKLVNYDEKEKVSCLITPCFSQIKNCVWCSMMV